MNKIAAAKAEQFEPLQNVELFDSEVIDKAHMNAMELTTSAPN